MITAWDAYGIVVFVLCAYGLYLLYREKHSKSQEAYAFISALFCIPIFLDVIQGILSNHGDPVNLREYNDRFDSIIKCWASNPQKPVHVE